MRIKLQCLWILFVHVNIADSVFLLRKIQQGLAIALPKMLRMNEQHLYSVPLKVDKGAQLTIGIADPKGLAPLQAHRYKGRDRSNVAVRQEQVCRLDRGVPKFVYVP